ncbi:MAG TPA: peroxiredoxin [Allosphingosinicella sp.]
MVVQQGELVPDVKLEGPDGNPVSPTDFSGQKLVVYFYPKDDTSGCTREAQEFTALADQFAAAGTWVMGVSKDSAAKHRKFTDKYQLKVALATDADGSACEAFDVWVEKSMYGRKYMGIERATFLVDRDGVVKRVWRKVSVPDHAQEVLRAAQDLP